MDRHLSVANEALDVIAGPSGGAPSSICHLNAIAASACLHLHVLAAARPVTKTNPAEANPAKDTPAKAKSAP